MKQAGKPLRIGLVGCGTVARQHAERLAGDARATIALCCDPDRGAAVRLRDALAPEAAVETEAAAAMARHELDAVVICSPTLLHYEHVCRAFELELDVLCEKPLAGRRDEIVDLVERAGRLGRVLALSYQRRYKAPYRTARRELNERRQWYGPLEQVHIFVCERWQQTIRGTWRDDPEIGAGYFGDAGSHQIDIVDFIAGTRAEAVWAHSEKRGSRVEIVTQAVARLDNGAGLAAHFVGNANHWREDIHFHCREADLLLRSEQLFRCRENRIEPVLELEAGSSPDAALLDAILEGKPVASPGEIALPMFNWTEAVLESIRSGKWVELATSSGES